MCLCVVGCDKDGACLHLYHACWYAFVQHKVCVSEFGVTESMQTLHLNISLSVDFLPFFFFDTGI